MIKWIDNSEIAQAQGFCNGTHCDGADNNCNSLPAYATNEGGHHLTLCSTHYIEWKRYQYGQGKRIIFLTKKGNFPQ